MQWCTAVVVESDDAIGSSAESDTCLVVVTVFKIVAPALRAGGWVRFPPSPPNPFAGCPQHFVRTPRISFSPPSAAAPLIRRA